MDKKEYIERGALVEMLNNKVKTDHEMGLYNHGALTESFIRFVERQPAADVAPKSEVAREIFEEIERKINDLEYQANMPRKTVKVEELKAQTDWVLHEVVPQMLAELKKKYTGDATDTNVGGKVEGKNV